MFREHVGVGARPQSTGGNAQHGRLSVQDLVHLVPVLLRTESEEIDRGEVDRTRHRTEVVIDVTRVGTHVWDYRTRYTS